MYSDSSMYNPDFANFGEISKFGNPTDLFSSTYFPRTLTEAFSLCEYFYYLFPRYRHIQARTIRYFITDIEYSNTDSEKQKRLDNILKNVLDIFYVMANAGDYWACYGNAFARLAIPYIRYFYKKSNPKDRHTFSYFAKYENVIKFDPSTMTYVMPDPDTQFKTFANFEFEDVVDENPLNLKIILENPRDIRISYNPITDSTRYIYKFPEEVKQKIASGSIFTINTTPKQMLSAIIHKKDFCFNDGEIFHFRSPMLKSISKSNWGLSEMIANFRSLYKLLLYDKADETVALDMMLPMRIFSMPPDRGLGSGDVTNLTDAFTFKTQMERLVANKRAHPTSIQIAPFAVKYDEYGGTGKNYAPKDLKQFEQDNLLISSGLAVDFFNNQININIIPTALRLFQNTYFFYYNGLDKFVKWITKKVQHFLKEQATEVTLQMPKYADNLEMMNVKMNLGTSGLLPYATMLESLGIKNPVDAILQRRKEDLEIESKTRKLQLDQQRKDQAQDILMAESDSVASGGSDMALSGLSILDKKQEALVRAQQLLRTPVGERRKQLEALKVQDSLLYDMVMGNMKDARNDMRSQGSQLMKEQNGYV